MAYLAFYRTFRPSTFDGVVRQEHIVRILKNQIDSGKIGHAYLFCGPRGTGKTTLAKIFARAINCENPQNSSPCGKCATCRALAGGAALDISEIDAASNNGVDEMRDLREKVQYPPVAGKYKVYIIDEVHMLTPSAFNAVLKTLEEPPRHAVFILATTEPQKIPATILSRCMRFDFKLIPQKDLEELIKSVLVKTGKEYEDAAVSAIARAGAGSARDSLSIADMCASYSRGKLTYGDVAAVLGSADIQKIGEICAHILNENSSAALSAIENVLSTGKSVGVLIKDILSYLNNLAIVKVCRDAEDIINLPAETYRAISETAKACDGHKLLRVTEIFAKAETDLRFATNGRITIETAAYKASMPETDYNIDALIGKINALQSALERGEYSVPAAAPAVREERIENLRPAAAEEPEQASGGVEPKQILTELSEPEQPTLWESAPAEKPRAETLGDEEKRGVFAKLIKCLRTTHKNAVLFTLCMDLQTEFEGDKFILYTDSEPVYKGLMRQENDRFLGEVLLSLGISGYEVRFRPKGASDFERALGELKSNFGGIDIKVNKKD